MTTELEKEFFEVFEIEPIKYILPLGQNFYWQDDSRIMQETDYKMFKIIENDLTEEDKKLVKFIYPEITDRKLLEMICILQGFRDITFNNLYFEKIEDLKNEVLSQIYKCKLKLHEFNAKQLQDQIQQLFKEEEDETRSYYKDIIGEKEYNNISIMAKIEDILYFYATSFISPLQYPNIHYDTSKAREGLKLLKFIEEYYKCLERENEAYQLSENEAEEIIAELKYKNKELKKELKSLYELKNTLNKMVDEDKSKTKEYRQALEEIRSYCDEQNLKADYTACYITNRIDEVLNDRA